MPIIKALLRKRSERKLTRALQNPQLSHIAKHVLLTTAEVARPVKPQYSKYILHTQC